MHGVDPRVMRIQQSSQEQKVQSYCAYNNSSSEAYPCLCRLGFLHRALPGDRLTRVGWNVGPTCVHYGFVRWVPKGKCVHRIVLWGNWHKFKSNVPSTPKTAWHKYCLPVHDIAVGVLTHRAPLQKLSDTHAWTRKKAVYVYLGLRRWLISPRAPTVNASPPKTNFLDAPRSLRPYTRSTNQDALKQGELLSTYMRLLLTS